MRRTSASLTSFLLALLLFQGGPVGQAYPPSDSSASSDDDAPTSANPDYSDEDPAETDTNAAETPSTVLRSALRRSMLARKKEAGLTPQEQNWIDTNCKFGMPKPAQSAGLGPIRTIVRQGYVLGHSSECKIPYWVCEHVDKRQLTGSLPRKDGNKPERDRIR